MMESSGKADRAVGANHLDCGDGRVPHGALADGIPLFYRALKRDTRQVRATVEGIGANTRDLIGNGDAREVRAVVERVIANARDTSV